MSSYDQNLLGEVPKATRAQLQEGYNVDLLDQPSRRTPSVRSPPPPETTQPQRVPVPLVPAIANAGSGEKLGSAGSIPAATTSHTSFWRSRNGVIVIVLAVLIVIGAVVGGAVGGTIKSSNRKSATSSPGPPITPVTATVVPTTASEQGIGQASTTASLTPSVPTSSNGQHVGGQVVGAG